MSWLGIGLFLLLIAPVKAGVRLQWDEGGLRGAAGLMIWGFRAQADFSGARNTAGRFSLEAAYRGNPLPLPKGKGNAGKILKLMGLLLKSNGDNARLRKTVRVDTLDVALRLGAGDAAALALGTGALRAVGGAIPFLRFRCIPALGGKSALRAVCIARARLGILLIAIGLWNRKQKRLSA